jgi:hypothetical protein
LPAFYIVDWANLVGKDNADWLTLVLFFLGFLASQHAAVTTAILLNVNLPETRGTVAALGSALDDVSRAVGPPLFAWISSFFNDDTLAFQATLIWWIISGLLLVPVTESLEEDERNMGRVLEELAAERDLRNEKDCNEAAIVSKIKEAGNAFRLTTSSSSINQ